MLHFCQHWIANSACCDLRLAPAHGTCIVYILIFVSLLQQSSHIHPGQRYSRALLLQHGVVPITAITSPPKRPAAPPRSSYVPYPVTFLHKVDAMVKQLWLVVLFVVIARSAPTVRVAVAAGIAAVTAANLPPRLWRSQLARLAALCGLIFVLTALGADGVPPVLQPRAPPAGLDSLPACPPPEAPYEYVLLHAWFITVTKRSVNMAITAATLTFSSLQAASLVLVTTPGEEMALALRRWLAPLALVGVKTQEVALTLLLSLRFMSLVFDEIRNMALGLAARGVDWKAQGSRGSLEIFGKLLGRLFGSLFDKSEKIAQAMVVRGFAGPEAHNLYMMRVNPSSVLANAVALAALAGLLAAAQFVR